MAQRGESIVSMKIASVVGGVQPLLARAGCSKMPRKSLLNRSRKLPGTSRSSLWLDPGDGCENMLRALAGRLELERFVSFSYLFPGLSGSIPGKAEKTCETQHQPVALLGR